MEDNITYREEEQPGEIAPTTLRQILQTAALGVCVGLLAWFITFLLGTFILKAVLCQGQLDYCSAASLDSGIIASLLASVLGLFGLVRFGIFRPLLVVIAVTVSVWNIAGMAAVLPWFGAVAIITCMYMLAYTVFAWLARIRLFSLSLLCVCLLVVVLRLIIVA